MEKQIIIGAILISIVINRTKIFDFFEKTSKAQIPEYSLLQDSSNKAIKSNTFYKQKRAKLKKQMQKHAKVVSEDQDMLSNQNIKNAKFKYDFTNLTIATSSITQKDKILNNVLNAFVKENYGELVKIISENKEKEK